MLNTLKPMQSSEALCSQMHEAVQFSKACVLPAIDVDLPAGADARQQQVRTSGSNAVCFWTLSGELARFILLKSAFDVTNNCVVQLYKQRKLNFCQRFQGIQEQLEEAEPYRFVADALVQTGVSLRVNQVRQLHHH